MSFALSSINALIFSFNKLIYCQWKFLIMQFRINYLYSRGLVETIKNSRHHRLDESIVFSLLVCQYSGMK